MENMPGETMSVQRIWVEGGVRKYGLMVILVEEKTALKGALLGKEGQSCHDSKFAQGTR